MILTDKKEKKIEKSFTTITTKTELENYIYEEYKKYDTELNSLFFDIQVSMKKSEILKAYAEIQRAINSDYVVRMKDGKIMDELISDKEYDDIYTGNCKDFLESFNDREEETGFYRYSDDDEKLDFIW